MDLGSGEPDWPVHEARAGGLAWAPRTFRSGGRGQFYGDVAAGRAWADALSAASAEIAASLVLLLIRDTDPERLHFRDDLSWRLAQAIGTGRLVVPAADATWAARAAAAMPDCWGAGQLMAAAAALAAWCADPADPALRSAAEALDAAADRLLFIDSGDRGKVRKHVLSLPWARDDGRMDASLVRPGSAWAAAVLSQARGWQDDCRTANLLLRHLAAATASKPSRTWLNAAAELAAKPDGARLLRVLVESAVSAGNSPMSDANTDVLRAACWAASTVTSDWAAAALAAIANRVLLGSSDTWYSAKVPNACIYGLGEIASPAAVTSLSDLQRKVRHAGFRKQIDAALASAARQAGISPSQLAERVVPGAGLTASRHRVITGASATARVTIGSQWRPQTEWLTPAGWAARIPAGTAEDDVRLARLAAKEVRNAIAGERARLEGLLATDRSWPLADWRRLYLEHPVTGSLAAALIWVFDTETGSVAGIPSVDGLDTLAGEQGMPATAYVRLWHPASASTAEVAAWRDYLVGSGQRQPFRQAFCEVYLPTPAELETRTYSNRFAGHILRYQQTFALVKERGWTTNYLSRHDSGHEGRARRDFPDAGLTVLFDHYQTDPESDSPTVELCSTERVTFCRTSDRRRTPVALNEVPDLVFSEAMRDVDLFVAVTSIALDPQWADRGDNQHLDYWLGASFGELSQAAVIRRDALARLLPKLKITSQLDLTDRHLLVRGHLNSYKIHIGSGGVLIEPDDRYLCIVAVTGRANIMLPFDDDQVLSVILSKAFMLAADDKITDQTILSQLPARLKQAQPLSVAVD